jgi:hypothetical protein
LREEEFEEGKGRRWRTRRTGGGDGWGMEAVERRRRWSCNILDIE